ncbi:MAG: DUF2141 domain-containing protein [Bacteroidota bacterium]
MLKSKLFFFFVFTFLVAYSQAQTNPNALADTLNSKLNQIDTKINNAVLHIEEATNPNLKLGDSVAQFDSLHGKLVVIIKNLKNATGNVNVALFNNYKNFAERSKPYRGAVIPLEGLSCTVTFDSIPKGVYSIAAFQDEDKNGVLRTNQLNIPLEGYCFSNNIGTSLGPPDYNQIKFYYSGKNKTMVLYMTYFKFPK